MPNHRKDQLRKQIRELRETMRPVEIAAKLDISRQLVNYYLKH